MSDSMRSSAIRYRLASLIVSALVAVLAVPGAVAQMPSAPVTPEAKVSYPDGVEAVQDVTYATALGYRPLKLDIYRTSATGPKPAVIFVHGGGFMGGSPRMSNSLYGSLDRMTAAIAAKGYVVFSITYRLAHEARFPAQVQDAKAAVRWVRANAAKYGVDPDRIAIWGESVGGSVAALVGTTCGVSSLEGSGGNPGFSSCVRAAIDWYGVTDMSQLDAQASANATLIHNSPDSTQSQVLGCVLHFECTKEIVDRANPITYIDAKDKGVSFLIAHGDSDTAVSWKQSQIFFDALKEKGIDTQFDLVPGLNHNFAGINAEQRKRVMDAAFGFLALKLSRGER